MTKQEKLEQISLRLTEFFSPDTKVGVPEMVFIAGLSVLGRPNDALTREQKMDVMHIGTCALLEPMGYYRQTGRDADGFPQYEILKEFTAEESEKGEVLKDAIINYFADLLRK